MQEVIRSNGISFKRTGNLPVLDPSGAAVTDFCFPSFNNHRHLSHPATNL